MCRTGTDAIIGQAPWLDSVVPSRAPSTATTTSLAQTREKPDMRASPLTAAMTVTPRVGRVLNSSTIAAPNCIGSPCASRFVHAAAEDVAGTGEDDGLDVGVVVRFPQRVEQAGHQAGVQGVGVRVVEGDPRGVAAQFGANAFHDRSDPFVGLVREPAAA